MTGTRYIHLYCLSCGEIYSKAEIHSYCKKCTQPLLAAFDTSAGLNKDLLRGRRQDMWRYREMLPIENAGNIVSLGEGMTHLVELEQLGKNLGSEALYLKEEGGNPTGSFKARGLSMAVSKAKELGLSVFAIPTAGNAGSALAAYTAKIGGEAHIFMPESTPEVFRLDCEIMGARVYIVPGSIRDAAGVMAQKNSNGSWWDVSTLKEPFRLEGKKTMGYEIAEQFEWKLPDVIIYPTGGGTGLIGIWKAFREMQALGWIDHIPTRMIAVQTAVCNPIVQAFDRGADHAPLYERPGLTIANGLRVPKAFGDRLILRTIYESNGSALDVTDEEILKSMKQVAQIEGLFLSPEGAAVCAAAGKLLAAGNIGPKERIVLLNTGSAYKYVENIKRKYGTAGD